ncbi:MAG TPA: hypothetical protein VEC37_06600, partial [Bacillota bacterium]|nr:hypothetical protein [Bacillota bacterium]
LILIGVALLSSSRSFAQNVTVTNNTLLTNGTAVFNFAAPPPPAVCALNPAVAFLGFSSGNINTTLCTGLTLVSVQILFDDPSLSRCMPNPQAGITLTPTSATAIYTDCPTAVPPPPPTTYTFVLIQVGLDWEVVIF